MDGREQSIKKIKTIQGYKVNHPFSAGNLFFSFLLLLVVAFPVGCLFVPFLQIVNPADGTVLGSITGLDLFRYVLITLCQEPTEAMQFTSLLTENLNTVAPWFFLGQGIILVFFAVIGVLAFVYLIISLVKGYLSHPRVIMAFNNTSYVLAIILDLSFITMYLMEYFVHKENTYLRMWWSNLPAGVLTAIVTMLGITHHIVYKDCVYEKDLDYHADAEAEVTHVSEVHEVKKVTYEKSNVLPPNITSIGGHAFAENQDLVVANIPVGIDKLGSSAFANCLQLKVVSLPISVKEIGFNCFFNCVELARINYAGTKQQWRHIRRGSNWLAKAKTTEVVCVDGPIVVNPYH